MYEGREEIVKRVRYVLSDWVIAPLALDEGVINSSEKNLRVLLLEVAVEVEREDVGFKFLCSMAKSWRGRYFLFDHKVEQGG